MSGPLINRLRARAAGGDFVGDGLCVRNDLDDLRRTKGLGKPVGMNSPVARKLVPSGKLSNNAPNFISLQKWVSE